MEVAIKSMKDQPKASTEDMDFAFENFLMEIKIMQILDTKHPNVVAYLGAVTSDLSRCKEKNNRTYIRSATTTQFNWNCGYSGNTDKFVLIFY